MTDNLSQVVERNREVLAYALRVESISATIRCDDMTTILAALQARGEQEGERRAPWKGRTVSEQATYDHYMGGSTRGDLYVNVKRGRAGILKPDRVHGHAYAAWMAGRDLAAQEAAPAPRPDRTAEARELLAREYERDGYPSNAAAVRRGAQLSFEMEIALRAIEAALQARHVDVGAGEVRVSFSAEFVAQAVAAERERCERAVQAIIDDYQLSVGPTNAACVEALSFAFGAIRSHPAEETEKR